MAENIGAGVGNSVRDRRRIISEFCKKCVDSFSFRARLIAQMGNAMGRGSHDQTYGAMGERWQSKRTADDRATEWFANKRCRHARR